LSYKRILDVGINTKLVTNKYHKWVGYFLAPVQRLANVCNENGTQRIGQKKHG